ncbi:hypothetical protein FHY55_00365 [Oceanicola sp. D3]|uniref:hypothetical protein n=1 Tax=Oceanicola sp. D3 TaxID=2587163 RepID=UPI00111F3D96|nr:hypothetical protein [Oceanicola sp. D3]QDC07789.1 hypothetical protein FHY55_00365 [Oceanicola sp. D3]
MKQLLVAALLALAALPGRADAPPQGSFMLGSYIWPEHVLPRSVVLTFEGEQMQLHFLYPLPLDHAACDREGVCEPRVQAATATARIDAGKLVLEAFEIDRDAAIEPSTVTHVGMPQDAVYTNFAISFLQMARFAPNAHGFTLDSAGTTLEFFEVRGDDALAIAALPVIFEQSIAKMAGCEVRALAPLLAETEPTEKEARFQRVVRGFGTSLDYDFAARRAAPRMAEPTEEERMQAAKLRAASGLPGMVAGIFRTSEDGGVDEFRAQMGLKMFRDDAEAFDAVVAAYGEALPDMIAFLRYVPTVPDRLNVDGLCADPSLGFMD